MGLSENGMECNYGDYCPRFYDALKKIDAGQHAEKELDGPPNTLMMIKERLEPEEIRCAYSLRSAHRKQLTIEQPVTSAETPSANVDENENADLKKAAQVFRFM